MRLAALTTLMATGQSLTGGSHLRPRSWNAPSLSKKRRSRFPWRLATISLAGASLLYAFSQINETGQPRLPIADPMAAPLPAWIEIPAAAQAFHVEAPEFEGAAEHYVARQHRIGGGRQDIWEFGDSGENAPLLNLIIHQPGKEGTADSSFYVELARRAAETGRAIIRAEQPSQLATRFGAFEVARLDLARDGTSRRECLGFRFANMEPKLHIAGFACTGKEALASPSALKAAVACVLDRIDLTPTAQDKGLVDFFAAHYASPGQACPGSRMDPAPSPPEMLTKARERAPSRRKRHHKSFN